MFLFWINLLIMMIKILLIIWWCGGETSLGQHNLQWFFNPFKENQRTFNIDNHAKVFDESLGISRQNRDIEVTLETNDDNLQSKRGRSLRQRNSKPMSGQYLGHMTSIDQSEARLRQRSSEPQLPPFRFRPFESLARNINFRSPSNVFCKHSFIIL